MRFSRGALATEGSCRTAKGVRIAHVSVVHAATYKRPAISQYGLSRRHR